MGINRDLISIFNALRDYCNRKRKQTNRKNPNDLVERMDGLLHQRVKLT